MTDKRSRQDFMEFLDWISQKGLMSPNTISARRAAASKVLAILDDEEAQDVTKLDVDDLMRRFGYKEGKNYTPGSLQTYASRLRSALDDFKVYVDEPMNFRPGVQPRERRKAEPKQTPRRRREHRSRRRRRRHTGERALDPDPPG